MSEPRTFDPSRHLSKVGNADYLEVKWRLVWLREVHPDATISTELVAHDPQNQWAMFRASISIPGGGSAAGHGSESVKDFREYIEKAETKAIGRALAALGFGTQFCDDFDFGQGGGRVVDAPVNGLANTTNFPPRARGTSTNTVPNGHVAPSGPGITGAQVNYIDKLAAEAGLDAEQIAQWAEEREGIPLGQYDKRQASAFIEALQAQARANK